MGEFVLNCFLLGLGLAMDAFSVSVAAGLAESDMKKSRAMGICGVFGGFQFLMPMLGWVCVRTILTIFSSFSRFIPWIALILLCWIGGKMIWEAFKGGEKESSVIKSTKDLLVLGVATSIDALSTGFAISDYGLADALLAAAIIGVVTFAVCLAGILIGKKLGGKIAGKAPVLGGIILIAIGIEIFVKGVFGA